jgi:hypothetical protein
MAATANGVKQKWNQAHYMQVKVSVPHELAKDFKDKCKENGVSMAAEISSFMRDKTGSQCANKLLGDPYETRPKRRKAVLPLIEQLEYILAAELQYMDNIPDNLRASVRYEAAELTVSCLEDAVNSLSEAY